MSEQQKQGIAIKAYAIPKEDDGWTMCIDIRMPGPDDPKEADRQVEEIGRQIANLLKAACEAAGVKVKEEGPPL